MDKYCKQEWSLFKFGSERNVGFIQNSLRVLSNMKKVLILSKRVSHLILLTLIWIKLMSMGKDTRQHADPHSQEMGLPFPVTTPPIKKLRRTYGRIETQMSSLWIGMSAMTHCGIFPTMTSISIYAIGLSVPFWDEISQLLVPCNSKVSFLELSFLDTFGMRNIRDESSLCNQNYPQHPIGAEQLVNFAMTTQWSH